MKPLSKTVALDFSGCDYHGYMTIGQALCMFEKSRFEFSVEADIQDYFEPKHRATGVEFSCINDEGEYFIMPIIENDIQVHQLITFGTTVVVQTILDKPIGSHCIFHHTLLSEDKDTVYLTCKTVATLVGNSSGLRFTLPDNLYNKIVDYIDKHV